jgi:hypothetical protein
MGWPGSGWTIDFSRRMFEEAFMKWHRLPCSARGFAALLIFGFPLGLPAQGGSQTKNSDVDPNKLWTFTRDEQRAEEHLDQTEGPVVERKTLARVGFDGHYLPYQQVDKRTLQVNATTVRNTERTYAIDPEGHKTLTLVVHEERQDLGGGAEKSERTTSAANAGGRLHMVRQESETSRPVSPTVRETDITILAAQSNGGPPVSSRMKERETQKDDHTVEFRRSTLLPDGKGGWLLSQVREGTIHTDGGVRSEDDRVSQPDAAGKLAVVERVVSKKSEAPGKKQEVVETYSPAAPGQTLELVRRVTTTSRPRTDGSQLVEEQVEETSPASPGEGLQLTRQKIDIVMPGIGTAGKLDSDAGFGSNRSISIDTRRSNNPTVEVDTSRKPR